MATLSGFGAINKYSLYPKVITLWTLLTLFKRDRLLSFKLRKTNGFVLG